MNIIEKVNRSRYTLKEVLSTEWDTSVVPDLSIQEISDPKKALALWLNA